MALILGVFVSAATQANPRLFNDGNDSYVYHSTKLNVSINMPADWQGKVTTTENEGTVTVSYNNPGAQQVFLYSVNKVDQQTWMNVKDNLQGVHVISNKDGMVYFVELTDKISIKGANAKEFKAIVAGLNDMLANIKVG